MEKICEELDEVKVEIEKLREECQAKTELCGSLRKGQDDLAAKLQEARLEIERQAEEMCVKSKEIFEVRQLYEGIKSKLQEKESFLQNLNSAHQKMRVDYCEKIVELEGENKKLVLALDEAMAKIHDLEKKTCASDKEINVLKESLSVRKVKSVEAPLNLQASRELKEANEIIHKLEEDNRISQEQLKWKNEQFTHLEDAHRRLRDDFRASEAEWGKEKSELLEEISSLQTSLASHIRISKDLETQLRMCNQALAHEESRRKVLEVEVSDLRSQCDGILLEHQETKAQLENLTLKRDDEIGELRNLLRTKEILFKEMKCRTSLLEQENLDLHASVKELQHTELSDAAARSSTKKLQTRLKSLEKLHNECSLQYKQKEAKFSSDIEKLTGDMKECVSELNVKKLQIENLEKDLEDCHSSMYVQNEYISILLLVLKSEFHYAATGKHLSSTGMAESELHSTEKDKKVILLKEQLESMETAHFAVSDDLKEKSEETMVLKAEVQRLKEKMEESSKYKLWFNGQMQQTEISLQEKERACEALEKATFDLAKRTSELRESELEAEKWKSAAEFLKKDLENNKLASEKESKRLLGILKEQDSKASDMQQKISELESMAKSRADAVEKLKKGNDQLKQDLANSELKSENAKSDALLAFEKEKQKLLLILEVRDKQIHNLTEQAKGLKKNLAVAETVITQKDELINETLQKAESSKTTEIESKNKVIAELEAKVSSLLQVLESQEKSLLNLKEKDEELEAMLEGSKMELEGLKSQFGLERMKLELKNEELESEKSDLVNQIMNQSHNLEAFLLQMDGMYTRIGESLEDVELQEKLQKMLKRCEDEDGVETDDRSAGDNHTNRAVKSTFLPTQKWHGQRSDERIPLKERNY
ncbi:hypothetical protein DM860_003145 [Cuscuta australis]|uniref:Uncharacterized protein n=1 Tax=Cuscuta australis TaxID=267555 RepID=A0A328D1G5_9ASTE|nr:hypothetical protein DM860_003145 [Cuscuta australis]